MPGATLTQIVSSGRNDCGIISSWPSWFELQQMSPADRERHFAAERERKAAWAAREAAQAARLAAKVAELTSAVAAVREHASQGERTDFIVQHVTCSCYDEGNTYKRLFLTQRQRDIVLRSVTIAEYCYAAELMLGGQPIQLEPGEEEPDADTCVESYGCYATSSPTVTSVAQDIIRSEDATAAQAANT